MSKASIRGLVAPLLTPFDDDQSIATGLFVEHAKRLLDQGCSGLVPFGTTGEALSVGIDERIAAVSSLVNSGIDPACMIPGTGVSNVADTARLSRACLDLGCAGVLVLPPFYYKAVSEQGLYEYFARLVDAVGPDSRIYLYHIPPVAVVGISTSLAARLHADFAGQVIGIKDSSGDWDNTRALLRVEGLRVYPGSELPLIDALQLGAPGCVTATANVNATAIAAVIEAFDDGDIERAKELHAAVREFRLCVQGLAPIPAQKRLLALASGDERWANIRPPLTAMPETEGRELLSKLRGEFDFKL